MTAIVIAFGLSGCKVYRWTGHRDAWTPPTPAEVVPPPIPELPPRGSVALDALICEYETPDTWGWLDYDCDRFRLGAAK